LLRLYWGARSAKH